MIFQSRRQIRDLLNLANDFRAELNEAELKDIPQSIPGSAQHCIIANAFNRGCVVWPGSTPEGSRIQFRDLRDLETYCKLTGMPRVGSTWIMSARLTPELNEIALKFDKGKFGKYNGKYSKIYT